MYPALFPWAIGLQAYTLPDVIAAARKGGFGGVEFNPNEVADLIEQQGANAVRAMFAAAGIKPAAFGLPTDWRTSEENWRRDLEVLPRQAKAAAEIGCTRTMTWILSGDNERPLEVNRAFHIARFRPIARILGDYGIRLGLEFLGPKTLRESFTFPFLYRMEGMLAMGEEIGPNVGLLLDAWHWYTSGGTLEDLRALRAEQVVYVHVNDAPVGIPIEEQIDNVRALPGETGVIDIVGFLKTLQAIGYDGPVTPEPFKKELNDLPSDDARLHVVGESMRTIFQRAGLPVERV
jgi:sugar phosphate isomerase/epimerase